MPWPNCSLAQDYNVAVVYSDNPTIASGVVLYSADPGERTFLLLQSARHQTWGFAKGHVDGDETLLECALREVSEETGYKLSSGDVFDIFNDCSTYTLPKNGQLKRTVMFVTRNPVVANELQVSDEHQRSKWCSLSEALELLEHQQSKTCLLRAADWLQSN
jgi:8-oxo-dGTP pyrophosphatase MutT (NUDIX family)